MITIIIKSSLSLLLLYGLYWFFLRNEKAFVFNRYYLVFSLVFSLFVPFINIPINVHESESIGKALVTLDNNIQSVNLIQENVAQGNNSNIISGSNNSPIFNISLILVLCYILGLVLLTLRFLRNIYQINKTIRTSEKIQFNGYRIILTSDNPGPHSFFKNVFLNRDDYQNGRIDKEVLNHELEHIKQLHTVDIIIVEVVKIFYWFNPIYLLYDRAIRINHEYLADHNVIGVSYNIKNYAEKLFSFISTTNIPLTSGSSYSFTKRRLIMLSKSKSRLFMKRLRIASTLGMAAIVLLILGFKISEKQSSAINPDKVSVETIQNVVKGIVLKEDGKPLRLVTVVTPSGTGTQTGSDGRFVISNLQKDDLLQFSCIGYKNQKVKTEFAKEMVVNLQKDPDFKSTVMTRDAKYIHEGDSVTIKVINDNTNQALFVLDDKIINIKGKIKLKRDDIVGGQVLTGKDAIDKYGEKGKYGVVEIITKKRADELGIKPQEPEPTRTYPEDFPTFQGKSSDSFTDWVIKNIRYPDEAKKNKIQGRVSVNLIIEGDGSVNNVTCIGLPNAVLKDAVIKAVQNSPKWDPAKNPAFKKPMPLLINLKFELPDKILKDDVLMIGDEMPSYPGGDEALMKYINENIKYPTKAKTDNIQGRVILRFVINKQGNAEDPTVLKSVNPLLDAEAVRVVSMLSGWKPALKTGKPVSVFYSLPVTFSLN
jgi:TonB family protein